MFPLNTDLSKAPDINVISHTLLLPKNVFKGFIYRILSILSITDVVVLKIFANDVENTMENIHDLRENVLYMISLESFVTRKEDN